MHLFFKCFRDFMFSFSIIYFRCCNRLHCTSCDNQIVVFDDLKWNEDKCDYLAFRNNYPDYGRLKHLFLTRKGSNDISYFDAVYARKFSTKND